MPRVTRPRLHRAVVGPYTPLDVWEVLLAVPVFPPDLSGCLRTHGIAW